MKPLCLFIPPQCLLYFTARLPNLADRLQALSADLTERFVGENKSDLDPVFSKLFDEDYDEKVAGVTRTAFVRIYAEWIRYCVQRCKDNEVSWPYFHPIHILTYLWQHPLCDLARDFHPILPQSCAIEDPRSGEGFHVCRPVCTRRWVQKDAVGTAPSHVSIPQIRMARWPKTDK